MHPDDETLHAHLDGALEARRAAVIAAHLASCAECVARMTTIRADTAAAFAALSALDAPVPHVPFDRIAARGALRPQAPPIWRWATAALVALTVSGLAIASPSSRVGGWIRSLFQSGGAQQIRSSSHALPARPVQPRDDALDRTGVTIVPGDSLRIEFAHWQTAGDMTVTLVDSTPVTVRTVVGAASFSSGWMVLGIENTSPDAHFDVWLPRRAAFLEIRVAGESVFRRLRSSTQDGGTGVSDAVRRISLVKSVPVSQTHR